MSQPSMYQESLRAFLRPILKYLDDDAVSEIMVNAHDEVWVERSGKLILTDAKFSEEGLTGAARNIAQFVGRVLNDERPRLDARLPDGSRIHIVLGPVARRGTTICIRKFFRGKLGIRKLIEFGALTPPMARLIQAMVCSKLNVIVAGGTSSGKTTLLNVFSGLVPSHERLVTIEDSAELQLQREHLLALESRPADKFGKGQITLSDLLDSSLRLRPDRIIVGEVRGGEAFALIQALNTGHGGSMATVHANSPTDTLRRFETLCLMSGVDIPMIAVRAQVASAVHAILVCERSADGARRIVAIAEALPLDERGEYRTQNLFVYAPTHRDAGGRMHGYFAPTGLVPTFLPRLRAHGFTDIDERFFDPATYGLPPPPSIYQEKVQVQWAPSLKHRERGEADPEAIRAQMAQSAEYAEKAEKAYRDRLAAGTLLEGFDFFDPEAAEAKESRTPPPAPAPSAAPAATPAPASAGPRAAARTPVETPAISVQAPAPEECIEKTRQIAFPPEPRPAPRPSRPEMRAVEPPPRPVPPARPAAPGPARGPARPPDNGPSIEVDASLLAEAEQHSPTLPAGKLPPGKRPLPPRPPAGADPDMNPEPTPPMGTPRFRR